MSDPAEAPALLNYALLVEYAGHGFCGWQSQADLPTLQGLLEAAASRLTGGAKVESVVAGRTDAGVHAEGQVAMLPLPAALGPRRVRDALNFHLKPHAVAVVAAALAPPDWNPRFSAIRRTYRYRILNRPARPALDLGRVWHVPRLLDAPAMHRAAQSLIGRHDFTSFRAASCQAKGPVRTLDRLDVLRTGETIEIWAEARSFLHHQVRNMVGTLRLVGDGSWPEARVAAALAARDRAEAGPTAPPDGLCLVRVAYPADPFLGGGA